MVACGLAIIVVVLLWIVVIKWWANIFSDDKDD
jgi:hypothetical protein